MLWDYVYHECFETIKFVQVSHLSLSLLQTLNSSVSLSLSISTQAAVPTLLNCTPTDGPPAHSSEVYGVTLLPSPNAGTASFHTVSNLCLDNSTQYAVTLANTGGGDVLVDSVSSASKMSRNIASIFTITALDLLTSVCFVMRNSAAFVLSRDCAHLAQ